ncbi:MAG: DUF1611 domain-containing protein [Rickettsiales bacterium]|jgi:uncharacterized NAD-dependent epimerase/dehydratase family protein|nr:DUF1611 domain-containing protein [Rickettsiales bacterium]
MYKLPKPYLIYLGNAQTKVGAKIADALMTWSKSDVKAYCSLDDCKVTYDLPILTPQAAALAGIESMVIAFANSGGFLIDDDIKMAVRALKSGLDVISGMHVRLQDYPEILEACRESGKTVYNIRFYDGKLTTDDGSKRSGKRILTVGTDCSVGKMFASLALNEELQKRNINSKFVATGQTGIILSGEGIAIDAVISDFTAGAAAILSPNIAAEDFYVIEGQGSLYHPSFAGVSLGLLHGSQPDYLVICHDPFREKMRHSDYDMPSIHDTINLNMMHASLTNKNVSVKGIILNLSQARDQSEREKIKNEFEDLYNLPVADIFNFKVDKIVDNILS